MDREITPETLQGTLEELSYPALRPDAAAELKDVTVDFGDETLNLGAMISETGPDSYKTPEELKAAIEERIPDAMPP
ncbi:hypothetical protein L593_10760 [Salinarchaeum sp. Harcht-Bsk1]|uniref:hypothetical protein n=1 Tax=Salinarchaeum sp. Harcht-Bsk1 TaxID=1333523 RepID=UPI00034228D3|nr:hypothetical protein [Salinarchaeum sp. Harcht-Bsk1]AGN02097.1 hypothetical protein L593_10760 [Salinarchaeum sp. Harcht-Bsk1]